MKPVLKIGDHLPDLTLQASDGRRINLSKELGVTVVYGYPRTSPPSSAPIEGWDQIPGARGCTPQSCAFRDHHSDLLSLGATQVFGLSTQETEYQKEVVDRLHLPFAILSDADNSFSHAAGLETFDAGGMTLLKRVTIIVRDGLLLHSIFPVGNPENNAEEVKLWLRENLSSH